jgi:Family of unknown function (DUF6065)
LVNVPVLECYVLSGGRPRLPKPQPAPRRRAWMDEVGGGFANFCLPMVIANQMGWHIATSHTIEAIWDGGRGVDGVRVRVLAGQGDCPAISNFGFGILSWRVPFLFRTPPGWKLLARGPSNSPKDAIYPLEGLVDTDSSVATFTMNWIFTRTMQAVRFDMGEPFCNIIPYRIADAEEFEPTVADIQSRPELAARHGAWSESRREFRGFKMRHRLPRKEKFEMDYFRGTDFAHDRPENHRMKLNFRPFREVPANQDDGAS